MITDIVLGPPGTGKTTRLLELVEKRLAGGMRPDRIGYVSFTRRAADEAITRACENFKFDRQDLPYFKTLHSICYRALGMTSAEVLDTRKLAEFAVYAGIKVTGRVSDDGTLTGYSMGDRILFVENLARTRMTGLRAQYSELRNLDDNPTWSEVSRVARALVEYKKDNGLIDYTDMLIQYAETAGAPPLDELFVDEGQDLSLAQWQVVRKMATNCKMVTVAGDDDQAIYRWAGAAVDHFLDLQGDTTVLQQSYRVPRRVQAVAQGPLNAIKRRRAKEWRSRPNDGVVARAMTFEAANMAASDVLVLARNDYILREQVEPVLRRDGILYEKHGHPSIPRKVMDAAHLWERLRTGRPIAGEEARLVYSFITAGIGVKHGHKMLPEVHDEQPVDMDYLKENGGLLTDVVWYDALDRIAKADRTYMQAARRHGEKLQQKPRVRVSTIHGSKGGQADHVVLMTEMAHRTYQEMLLNPEDEARTWYVGATRAKERLTVVDSQTNRRCPWL